MRRAVIAAALVATVLAAPATGLAAQGEPRLTEKQALRTFLAHPKVADWLERYPAKGRTTESVLDERSGQWKVGVWWGEAGQIAKGRVDDATGFVREAWTGPQVAWGMARGGEGAFGGKVLNLPLVWLAFCAVFFLGLADLRRPLNVRNLDLLVLLSFSVSLWFFNEGDIFTSVPLAYPPLAYLLGRMLWIVVRGSPGRPTRAVWPIWLLAAATVFLTGFRVGLNVETSKVIDVGYAGVIGAQRIAGGEAPYGHMPEDEGKPCGPADGDGYIRDRIQTNGRCESANPPGDTYGPVSYQAYLPGYWLFGWTGKWDGLPAAHFTSIFWDLLAMIGLALVGLRYGGGSARSPGTAVVGLDRDNEARWRLAVVLPFAWAAFPFTQYVSHSNTNDAIPAVFLIWGFWLLSSPIARGASLALSGWTKLASLIVVPAWAAYPDGGFRRPRPQVVFAASFAAVTLLAFWILLLEPGPLAAVRLFYERTFETQIGRESPFSLWDWGQYHAAGIPDLELVQRGLMIALLAGAVVAFFLPRRRSPLQVAALTAALLIGFELVLTHWFYLYIPWFLGFVLFAILAPSTPIRASPRPEPEEQHAPELLPTG